MAGSPILPCPLPGHPRLLATEADWERLRSQVHTDPVSARVWQTVQKRADRILSEAPVQRVLTGPRLLDVSRLALDRIAALALTARVTNQPRYAERAIREMLAVARFQDWHPNHFLDVAEMSFALAVGYDWLQAELTPEEREEIAVALIEKGLQPSLDARLPHNWWLEADHNWAQVCHGGLSAAAIAVADREPRLAEMILNRALEKLPAAAEAYAPDGAYAEGPTYWAYGTGFHVMLAAALQRLSGHSFGLERFPGFAESAEYLRQVTAPSGHFFNYSDCSSRRRLLIPLFWLAHRFERAEWLEYNIEHLDELLREYEGDITADSNYYRTLPLALLWYRQAAGRTTPQALHWHGTGRMPVAVHRSRAGDPRALYVAVKGGSPSLNHAHMDVGSFILEADGIRWAVDPGMQDYYTVEKHDVNLWDASHDGQRWDIFRIGPDAHNILRFDHARQLVTAEPAVFTEFEASGPAPRSVLDLSLLYADKAASVRRIITMVENKAVLFQDEWVCGETGIQATWQMLTHAEVEIEAGMLRLRQDGRSLSLEIQEPVAAGIEVADVSAPARPFDTPNPGLKRIRVSTATAPRARGGFRILAVPDTPEVSPPEPSAISREG